MEISVVNHNYWVLVYETKLLQLCKPLLTWHYNAMLMVQIRAVSKLAISVLSIFQDYHSHLWSLAANKDDGD